MERGICPVAELHLLRSTLKINTFTAIVRSQQNL